MPAIVFYFQIHQPFRFRPYTVFDLGVNHMYEDAESNRSILHAVAEKAYLPMNALLLSLIKKYKGRFKVSFSISGTALDQFVEYAPEVLESFKALAKTQCVEFIDETYSHSLAFLYSREEFAQQVAWHRDRMERLLGVRPVTFRNTELIYNNDLARMVEDMGYEVVLTEGADHLLGWRSPNYVYQPANCHKLRLLLRNHNLSDDIAFRFSDQSWSGFPLTAEKYAEWIHSLDQGAEVINLFMDYETFGEHHPADTGIFDFMRALPEAILAHPECAFLTPSEAASQHQPVAKMDVPQYVSWADAERDLTAWLGNDMQLDAIESLYRLEGRVRAADSPDLDKVWRRLQTSDHFYYMSTKWLSDGEVHTYFNPYASPYDAYINFMNVLADFESTVTEAAVTREQSVREPAALPSAAAAATAPPKAGKADQPVAAKKKGAAKPSAQAPETGQGDAPQRKSSRARKEPNAQEARQTTSAITATRRRKRPAPEASVTAG